MLASNPVVFLVDPVVFLVDVDNTLLDNDRIQADLRRHLEREFGAVCRDRYWAILEQLFTDLGYRDYLGALQRYRVEHPKDIHLLSMSSWLVDYPFANRIYPGALDVLEKLRGWGPTVICPMAMSSSNHARSSAPALPRPSRATC